MTLPQREAHMTEAADVPLICDPVPGPPMMLFVPKFWSSAQMEKLRRQWGSPVELVPTEHPCQPLPAAQRIEWPDAEFCAA